jgi:hypothetical protein
LQLSVLGVGLTPTEILLQCYSEFLGEDFDHVLNRNFVAADDHVVMPSVADSFTALGQHGEVFVTYRRVHSFIDGVMPAGISSVVAGILSIQLCRTVHRVGSPSGRMSMISTAGERPVDQHDADRRRTA